MPLHETLKPFLVFANHVFVAARLPSPRLNDFGLQSFFLTGR